MRPSGVLGETLQSIAKFDAPIEQATTSSLEALKAFTRQDAFGIWKDADPDMPLLVEARREYAQLGS